MKSRQSQSLNILPTTSFLRAQRGIPSSRWAAIYVIMFLFADFYVGRRETSPQCLPSKPERLRWEAGWQLGPPDKVLSTQGPRKGGQRGRGRRRAKSLRSRIWERREAEGGVYARAWGAEWVEPEVLGTGPRPQEGGAPGGKLVHRR